MKTINYIIINMIYAVLFLLSPFVKVQTGKKRRKVTLLRQLKLHVTSNILIPEERMMDLFSCFAHTPFQNRLRRMSNRKTGAQSYFILMSTPVITHIVIATSQLSRSYDKCGIEARAIFVACTSNPRIPIPAATMTIYLADCKTFDDAQVATKKRTIGLASIRNDAWAPVYNHVKSCMAVAQSCANDNPVFAVTIIESGGFKPKSIPAAKVNIFTAKNNGTSGSALLKAPGAKKGYLHVFQKSVNGVLYVDCGSSIPRKLTITGVLPVSAVWFRHRATKEGVDLPEWEYAFMTANA